MSTKAESPAGARKNRFSIDTWAVFLALLAALLIRVGVLKHVPW